MSRKLDLYIQKEIDKIPKFEVISISADNNTLEYLETAVKECEHILKKLSKKDGKILMLIKDIKNNNINKKKVNKSFSQLSSKIKTHILKTGEITNPNITTLINNRINQLLKTIISNFK